MTDIQLLFMLIGYIYVADKLVTILGFVVNEISMKIRIAIREKKRKKEWDKAIKQRIEDVTKYASQYPESELNVETHKYLDFLIEQNKKQKP